MTHRTISITGDDRVQSSSSRASLMESTGVPPDITSVTQDAKTALRVYGDGSCGGAYCAQDDVMYKIFTACLQKMMRLLLFD